MEEVRLAYSVLAEQYIGLFGDAAKVHADDLALITRHLSIQPGVVLDVGCGPGQVTAYLRSLGVDASGIDLVATFVDHARRTYPGGRYEVGSMDRLPVPDHSVAGILAWYSLIHVPPDNLDSVLAELRRAMAPASTLVVGFFDGNEIAPFDHKVTSAFYWPVDEFVARLKRAGFSEIERSQPSADVESGQRSHAAIAAIPS